jgi:hypothetical protein
MMKQMEGDRMMASFVKRSTTVNLHEAHINGAPLLRYWNYSTIADVPAEVQAGTFHSQTVLWTLKLWYDEEGRRRKGT